jgi:hypothetical protein
MHSFEFMFPSLRHLRYQEKKQNPCMSVHFSRGCSVEERASVGATAGLSALEVEFFEP